MVPTDSEFLMLYMLYGITLCLIIIGLCLTSRKLEFGIHIIMFLFYSGLMLYVFSDKENFTGGGSLVILFYGILFPIVHLGVYGIVTIIRRLKKNNSNF